MARRGWLMANLRGIRGWNYNALQLPSDGISVIGNNICQYHRDIKHSSHFIDVQYLLNSSDGIHAASCVAFPALYPLVFWRLCRLAAYVAAYVGWRSI